MFRFARHISRKGQVIYRQGSGRPSWRDVVPGATALRIGTKLAGAMFALLVAGSGIALAEKSSPPPPKITGLVCDGTFQLVTGSVDSSTEETFDGPVHLVLVDREGDFVEVRAQAYERGILVPEQVFTLGGGVHAGMTDTADAGLVGQAAALVLNDSTITKVPAMPENPDDLMVEITATDMDVMLTQSLEGGPEIRARVDGKPLVMTRESIATTELFLDRINGDITMVWTENRVRDHKVPGAIRAAKVQLRNEKTFTGSCKPVAQQTF
jgi:hypothetical protein